MPPRIFATDRVLDGITGAHNGTGQEFGLDGLTDFLIRHHPDGLPVPEASRRPNSHHLEHHHGVLRMTPPCSSWSGTARLLTSPRSCRR